MWADRPFDEFLGSVDDDGIRGKHPPYRVVGTTGQVFDLHPWHVVRDHRASYPVLANEWAHMCESGRHAFFHGAVLLGKPSRKLLAKAIVVLRDSIYHDRVEGSGEHRLLWCVRMHYAVDDPGCGREFLWALNWQTALRAQNTFAEDPHMVTSSLMQMEPHLGVELFADEFAGARVLTSLENLEDRAFVASLCVVTHAQSVPISRKWTYPCLRGVVAARASPGCKPLLLQTAVRRSPRLALPPLVETLGEDLVCEVVDHVLKHTWFSARADTQHQRLRMRLVCRAFNHAVCEGMTRAGNLAMNLVTNMTTTTSLEPVYELRARFATAGISVFRAIQEMRRRDRDRNREAREASSSARIYIRLMFNKGGLGGPPPPPPPPKLTLTMKCAHGEMAPSRESHGYGTRKRFRVWFCMDVPNQFEPVMRLDGWVRKYQSPDSFDSDVCVFPVWR